MRFSALLLSSLLHLTPLMRVAVADSALVGSPLLAVLRWVVGATAIAGAFHGVSGATGMTIQQGGAAVSSPKGTSGTVIAGVRVSMFSNFGTPRSYFFTGLPPGLSGSLQGVITGIPTTPGSYEVTVIGWELPGGGGNNYLDGFPFAVAAPAAPDPPQILSPPPSQTLAVGSPLSLSAVVTGSGLTYQWRKDGVGIPAPAGTAATYALGAVQQFDAGQYTVVVTNAGGSAESASATVTVVSLPTFQFPPIGRTVIQGTSVSLTAALFGGGLSYQWFKDEVAIPGPKGTGATLDLGSVTSADAGNYVLTISNIAGTATSGPATLVVVTPPVITVPPSAISVAEGATAQLRVEASGAGLSFQWTKDDALIPSPAGTGAVLAFSAATPDDAGVYAVTVKNAAGAVTSIPVTVTVVVLPKFTLQPLPVSVKVGSTLQLTAAASGTGLSFQWFRGTLALPDAIGTSPTLTIAAATPADAGDYVLRVSNLAGSVSSQPVTVTITLASLEPTLHANLVGGTAYEGEAVTFTARVSTPDPVTFRWTKNGVVVPGATDPTLVMASIQSTDAGSYRAEATVGTVVGTTPAVDLSVLPVPFLTLSSLSSELGAALTFTTVPGRRFAVEELRSLPGTDWIEVGTVSAESTTARLSVPPVGVDVRLWRLRVLPVDP